MVFNKRDLAKAFSPSKIKKFTKKRLSGGLKPSTSGTTMRGEGAESSIKVIVRVRPHNERENQENYRTVIKVVDDQMLIFDPKEEENPFFYRGVVQKGRDLLKKQNKELQFVFDKVFNMGCSNQDIFEGSTKDLIINLLDGYNCSVFAYGATGAGKTHTMLGKDDDPGITFRTMAELFHQIELQKENRDFELGVTYLEIYNENVQDLLHKSGPLHLREDGRAGIIVAGLKIITIHSPDELLSLLAKGNRNRTQHPTDANEESSRSHAVFQVYVNITNKLDGQVKHVKLSMIDLAGSERASATGCKGARFKEGANINKSLLALGNCINNLADGIKHIPYRESKLTRLLKDSLGGNCQTVMIANISPSSMTYEDTCNTLRYANRAKKIKTNIKKNIVNCQMHVSGYIKLVEEQKKEIAMLRQQMKALENGPRVASSEPMDLKVEENTNKLLMEMSDRLEDLYSRKRSLNEKILALESSDKILCCRIKYKKAADDRLHNLTTAVDALTQEEQNASGKLRLNKSLQHFKRQRDGIRSQMETVWNDLKEVEEEIQALDLEIKSKDLSDKLCDKISSLQTEIEKSRLQQQCEHSKRINSLQLCEMHSVYTMTKMLILTVQTYYDMMRGYGAVNEKMNVEFKKLIKLLEGVRSIKWSDLSSTIPEEDSYSMTILSLDVLADPSSREMPIFQPVSLVENETQPVPKMPNGTPTGVISTIDPHNLTVTLEEPSLENLEEIEPVNSIEVSKLNNTVNLQEQPKLKKRILADKNVGPGRTPPKQVKKISPKSRVLQNGSVISGKENNKDLPRNQFVMSAKSLAILNKLKTDKLKPLPQAPSHTFGNNEQSETTLKAVRGKERRFLTSTHHPYHKQFVKPKFVPAVPSSSRV
ncbi:kinesin-like protein KIF18A [Belonocnema kinseyi]|uniref:kinesin-like protein KIF18A n=1 Tax=Belonocnema kinseyi TaxID=2817044 RepID=UPI00143D3C59|nr:kinesin-like protein KIF18A [Belonocnema kinseyi]